MVLPSETDGKRTISEWTEELRKAVQIALEARPAADAECLFCNRDGEGYVDEGTGTAKGWDSLWQGLRWAAGYLPNNGRRYSKPAS